MRNRGITAIFAITLACLCNHIWATPVSAAPNLQTYDCYSHAPWLATPSSGNLSPGAVRTISSGFDSGLHQINIITTANCTNTNQVIRIEAVNGRTCSGNLSNKGWYFNGSGSVVERYNNACNVAPLHVPLSLFSIQMVSNSAFTIDVIVYDCAAQNADAIVGCYGKETIEFCNGSLEWSAGGETPGDLINVQNNGQMTFDGMINYAQSNYWIDQISLVDGNPADFEITFDSQTGYTQSGGLVRIWDAAVNLIYNSNVFPTGQTFTAREFAIYSPTDFTMTISSELGGVCSVDCVTVENADFITPDNWTLFNTATISNSNLSLSGVGYAEQTITTTVTIDPDTPYTFAITATGTTSDTDILMIEFAGTGGIVVTNTIELSDTVQGYTATLTTGPSISTPVLRLLTLSGSADVDFLCFSEDFTFTGLPENCIPGIIRNPNFETNTDWAYLYGSVYNDVGQNGWVSYVMSGTLENGQIGSVGQSPLGDVPPVITDTEQYLILKFDAFTAEGAANISTIYRNSDIDFSIVTTNTFDVDESPTTFETDFTAFAGDESPLEIGFYNTSYLVTETTGIFIDNLCLFVATRPPTLPTTTEGFLDYDLPFSCATVSQWLSDTIGIDFPGLETMPPPSIWDPQDWVPWLASRLWIYAAKPLICILIALFNSGIGKAFLNWLVWSVRQPNLVLAWFGGWYGTLLVDLTKWLFWFTNPLLAVPLLLLDFLLNWQDTLTYAGSVTDWLAAFLQALIQYGFGLITAFLVSHLNYLIVAWNTFLPFVSLVFSEIVSVFVTIWNDWLAPYLSGFGGVWGFFEFLISQLGTIGGLLTFFFSTIWHFAQMVWGFLTGTAGLPLTFYYTFNDAVNGTAFELIPACTGDIANKWCVVLAGIEIVNQSVAHSFAYPITIVGIIMATIGIFWRHIWELLTFRFR